MEEDPEAPRLFQELVRRGMASLLQGLFEPAWWALNSALHLFPGRAPYLWGRGLAAFYSGRFAEGAGQFEADMTENGSDVEEVVWHFLCRCREGGFPVAQTRRLLPLAAVPTVPPMMAVLRMFRGDGTAEEVFSAARSRDGSPALSYNGTNALAYAHFYVGLYHEVKGDVGLATEHLRAASEMQSPDFVGKLMSMHFQLFLHNKTPSHVPSCYLGNGGPISSIIHGGWQVSSGHLIAEESPRKSDLVAHLLKVLDSGITVFDCGDIYTGVEELYGHFIAAHEQRGGRASDISVHTKLVPDLDAIRAGKVDAHYVRSVVRRSLNRLGVGWLALVQMYWWDASVPGCVDAAHVLRQLSEEGVVGRIGVTNFDVKATEELIEAGIPIVSTQVIM